MTKHLRIAVLLGLVLNATLVHAEDQAVVSTARELAKQGFQAYDEERYADAVERLQQAYQVVKVPTLAVQRARALVKLGKWIEASELYLEAMQLPHAANWQTIQDEALRDAERERGELLQRIPRIRIVIEGADPVQVVVTIDNAKVPTALIAAEQMVDPGQRIIVGKRDQDEARQIVSASESAKLQVVLRFTAAAPVPAPVPSAPATTAAVTAPPPAGIAASRPAAAAPLTPVPRPATPTTTLPSKRGSSQLVLGWVGIGLGGAGLTLGIVEGLVAASKRDDLVSTNLCPDGQHCDRSLSGDVDAYRTARSLSTIGFVAGGVMTAAGVTLLVLRPRGDAAPRIAVHGGPSYLAVSGALQ